MNLSTCYVGADAGPEAVEDAIEACRRALVETSDLCLDPYEDVGVNVVPDGGGYRIEALVSEEAE
jgi:hypothetical protein